jgi:hypothetical protein
LGMGSGRSLFAVAEDPSGRQIILRQADLTTILRRLDAAFGSRTASIGNPDGRCSGNRALNSWQAPPVQQRATVADSCLDLLAASDKAR